MAPNCLILTGDCREVLRTLPDASVHCCVTSPPYWGLRSYDLQRWEGGDHGCDHRLGTEHQKQGSTSIRKGRSNIESQRNENFDKQCACGATQVTVPGGIGLEPTFDEHLENLVAVFREIRRTLRPDGTLWLNYGDAYAGSWGAQSRGAETISGLSGGQVHSAPKGTHTGSAKRTPGLKPKDLMMMPARVAIALQADGWWLRSEIIWHKPNPMPESVTDRPTNAHEKLFLLTKSARYFYDADAVRVPAVDTRGDLRFSARRATGMGVAPHGNEAPETDAARPSGANLRNVWTIATHSFKESHFATFPPALVEPCIKAGTSERGVCGECGAPWTRQVDTVKGGQVRTRNRREVGREETAAGFRRKYGTRQPDGRRPASTRPPPFRPSCSTRSLAAAPWARWRSR